MSTKNTSRLKSTILGCCSSLLLLLTIHSCHKEDFDIPTIAIPDYVLSAEDTLISISDLKKKFENSTFDTIKGNYVISGIVVGDDKSGNFYKTLVIQDDSAGIELKIDRTDMYNEYSAGQRVYVKAKNLCIGDYHGVKQIGYPYLDGNSLSAGRIPDVLVKEHLFRDSLKGNVPEPIKVLITELNTSHISRYIIIDSLNFISKDILKPLADDLYDATNRYLNDYLGNEIVLRTSKYSTFATEICPNGKGSVKGIYSVYDDDKQLYLTNYDDIMFDTTIKFSVPLFEENFDQAPSGWIYYNESSSGKWTWSSQYTAMVGNGFNDDAPSIDWLISPEINLSGVASPRLSFRTWTKYTDASTAQPFAVMVTVNYPGTGDPNQASWTDITSLATLATGGSWTGSGNIELDSYTEATFRVAFIYRSSGTGSGSSTTWEVDEVAVTGIK